MNGSIGLVVGFETIYNTLHNHPSFYVPDRITKNPAEEVSYDVKGNAGHESTEFERYLQSLKKWPLVRFATRTVLCVPERFEVNNANGIMQAQREQVPLILAWALSVHKSQGQTLDRVRVNMKNVFENGQGTS